MAGGNFFQLLNEVLAFFSGLLRNALFEGNVDSSNGSGTGEGITSRGRCMNKRIAVHDAPNFGRGHEGADGHNAATKSLGRGDNIGNDIPMFDAPKFAGASHAGLYFVGNEQDFIFVADVAQARPEIIRRDYSTGLTLHRFHNDGSDIIAYLAGDTQLLLNGVGIAKGHMEDVIM